VSTPNGKIDVAGLAKKNQNKGKRDVSTPNGKIDVAGFAKKKGVFVLDSGGDFPGAPA
jgi:hypothetical protein